MTVEVVKLKLGYARVFSKLGMNEVYHQIELAEESRHITAFMVLVNVYVTNDSTMELYRHKIFLTKQWMTPFMDQRMLSTSEMIFVQGINKEEHDEAINALL